MSNTTLNADQTPEGWDRTTTKYAGKFSKNGFTAQYAKDALNFTMGTLEITEPSIKILDVACGTGALSLNALDRIKNSTNSLVLATDFSPNMIECVNETIKQENLTNIETKLMDGQNMVDIQDNSIDYAYSIFGAIFFPDRNKGFKEFHRVLKPNGKVAIAGWCYDSAVLKIFIDALAHYGVDVETTPIKKTALSLADKDQFKAELENAGFRDVVIHRVVHDMVVPSAKDVVVTFHDNPVYESIITLIPQGKAEEFDQLMINYINTTYPDLKLTSPSFIGIGTK